MNPTDKRMTAERCGYLNAVALVNKLPESWMAIFPIIPFTYSVVYFPTVFRWYVSIKLQNMCDYRRLETVWCFVVKVLVLHRRILKWALSLLLILELNQCIFTIRSIQVNNSLIERLRPHKNLATYYSGYCQTSSTSIVMIFFLVSHTLSLIINIISEK